MAEAIYAPNGEQIDWVSEAKNHIALRMEYSILRATLAANIQDFAEAIDQEAKKAEINLLIQRTAGLAEKLEHIYDKYLDVPHEVQHLREDLIAFHFFLAQEEDIQDKADANKHSHFLREWTRLINWLRLGSIRSKRLLDTVLPLAKSASGYANFIYWLDYVGDPFIAYLSWLYFLPRFCTNLFMIGKHTFGRPSMTEEEKQLGWFNRMTLSASRRWFELGNDVVWITVGLLNCFVLTGALGPIGSYLSFAALVYDILLAALRVYVDISRLKRLEETYAGQRNKAEDPNEQAMLDHCLEQINERLVYEEAQVYIALACTILLAAASSLTIPAVMLGPIGPLIAAAIVLSVTILTFAAQKVAEQYKPNEAIDSLPDTKGGLVTFGMFKPPAPENRPEIDYHQTDQNQLTG